MPTDSRMHRRSALLVSLGLLILFGGAWAQQPAPEPGGTNAPIDAALPPIERGKALVGLSAALVEQAGSSQVHASAFRIDVAYYRETLRDLVKDNDLHPEEERMAKPLLMDLVRMIALLQSAAQCQTGRYIVCPPDLMSQLHRQQAVLQGSVAPLGTGQ